MFTRLFARREKPITGTVTFDASLLDDEDKPNPWKRAGQFISAVLGLIFLLFLMLVILGVPYLRWDEPLSDAKDGAQLHEENLAFTRYFSLGDSRRVHANEYGQGLPLVIWIPLADLESTPEVDAGL